MLTVAVLFVVSGSPALPVPVCGDVTADGNVDVIDAIALLRWIFDDAAPVPAAPEVADFNGNGAVTIADPIAILRWVFAGGAPGLCYIAEDQ